MSARHYIVPGFIAAFSGVVIWASLQLDTSPPMIVGAGMQPRVFPIFLLQQEALDVDDRQQGLDRAPPEKAHRESFHTWGSMLLMVLFYGLTIWLDMFIGIAVVMFLMCLLWGERRIHVAAASALITTLAIFVLFDKVLQVRFPRGIITNWYYG